MSALILAFVAAGLLVWALATTLSEAFSRYEQKYAAAGKAHLDALYLTLEPRQLTLLSIGCGAFMGLLAAVMGNLATGVVVGALGLFVPLLSLGYLKRRRQHRFNELLIDALGNMGNSLKAGFTLPQAIELIGREMDDPLGLEFRIANAEMRLGLPPVQALKNMSDRMQLSDLDLIVTAIDISEGIGGNLSRIFAAIAETIRERFRVEGRIRSLSAMGRLQGYVLIAMPFVICGFMARFQPAFIDPLFNSPVGHAALGFGLLWLGLGWISIKKIVDIDV